MLSLLRSGEAFPFLGEAERERERERDLLSADADRSLQEGNKSLLLKYKLLNNHDWWPTNRCVHPNKTKEGTKERIVKSKAMAIWKLRDLP